MYIFIYLICQRHKKGVEFEMNAPVGAKFQISKISPASANIGQTST